MTKQISAFLFCFIRELNLYSPLTYFLTSARELKPLPSRSAHPSAKSMGAKFEQKFHYNTQRCNYKTNSSESIKRHQYTDV